MDTGKRHLLPRIARFVHRSALSDIVSEIEELHQYALLYLNQGRTEIIVNGEHVELRAPALYVCKPAMKLEQSVEHVNNKVSLYRLDFQVYELASDAQEQLNYHKCSEAGIQVGLIQARSHAIRRHLQKWYAHRTSESRVSDLTELKHMCHLLELLVASTNGGAISNHEDSLRLSIDYMVEHVQVSLGIEQLAEIARMQPTVYTRRFKERMGVSPTVYLNQLRMNLAKTKLLQKQHKNIRELAQCCGFRDEFYFSRRFKQIHGISPTQYRLDLSEPPALISLSFPYTEHLLQLGITPRAAQVPKGLTTSIVELPLPYHAKDPWELSRNVFIECQPDLIVGKNNVERHAYRYIGDLAPILTFPWADQDVYDLHLALGQAMAREDLAKDWIARFQQLGQQARSQIAARYRGKVLAIVVRHAKGWRLYGMRNVGHVFYRMLGFIPPEPVAQEVAKHLPGTTFTWMDLEVNALDDIQADYLIFAGAPEEGMKEIQHHLQRNASWKRHAAVQAGEYQLVDWERWMVYAPLSLKWQLNEAVGYFSAD